MNLSGQTITIASREHANYTKSFPILPEEFPVAPPRVDVSTLSQLFRVWRILQVCWKIEELN